MMHYTDQDVNPQIMKYTFIAGPWQENWVKVAVNRYRTLGEILPCGFWDMCMDRQTNRPSKQYYAPSTGWSNNMYTENTWCDNIYKTSSKAK